MSRRRTVGFPTEWEPWCDPAVVLTGGPARVSNDDDADPGYEPPRIRGFGISVADLAPDQVQRLADVSGVSWDEAAAALGQVVEACRPAPLLWDGDQA